MQTSIFHDISSASDVSTFESRLISFAYGLDFELVNAALVIAPPGSKPVIRMVGNTPEAFLQSAHSPDEGLRDPVLQRLKQESIPFVYNQATYTAVGAGDLWEKQAQFGYVTGVSTALHLGNDAHFFLGIDRDRPLSLDDIGLTRMLADLQLLAVHAQHAASRLMREGPWFTKDVPTLSPREVDILRYVRDGKSSEVIGQLMGFSAANINYHVANAKKKLQCSTRMQAVVRAMNLKLL
jgi:DNA-binding CsgD family transcriptional regulator